MTTITKPTSFICIQKNYLKKKTTTKKASNSSIVPPVFITYARRNELVWRMCQNLENVTNFSVLTDTPPWRKSNYALPYRLKGWRTPKLREETHISANGWVRICHMTADQRITHYHSGLRFGNQHFKKKSTWM